MTAKRVAAFLAAALSFVGIFWVAGIDLTRRGPELAQVILFAIVIGAFVASHPGIGEEK